MSATLRVHQVLRASGLQTDEDAPRPLVRVTNALNEVWSWGGYIIRINPHAGHQRLRREAAILRRLPAEVRAPVVVGVGSASWGEWQVTRRLPGLELSRAWGVLGEAERRQAVTELAGVMKALHR